MHLLTSEACQGEDDGWAQGYPWAYHVKPYKFISYSSEWLFSAGDSWHYLSNSPFSLWFGSFEQCGPRQLVRTATSVTLPPGWRGRKRGGGGDMGAMAEMEGVLRGVLRGVGGCGMIGWGGLPESAFTSQWASEACGEETEKAWTRPTIYWLSRGTTVCCQGERGSTPRTKRSTTYSLSAVKTAFSEQLPQQHRQICYNNEPWTHSNDFLCNFFLQNCIRQEFS